jgi:drug/metabolite transporter (DMT)-like permease
LCFPTARFALAATALVPFSGPKVAPKALVVVGSIGFVLALAYLFQTTGLLFASPTNSGLITGLLLVIFAALFRYRPAGDRPVPVRILGGVLILAALAVGEVLPALAGEREKTYKKGGAP